MKTRSLKFKLITFAILSIIAVGVVGKDVIKNNKIKNRSITEISSNTEIKASKEEGKNQQLQEAEDKKQEEIRKKQEDLERKWKVGFDQFFEKQYEKAIETERAVLKEDPNFYKAYAVEGIALAYNGDFNKGIEQINKALELKPDYGYGRFNKGLANALFGHYDEAIEWYEKALEVEKFEWSYYGIASVYGKKGDINNTVKYLKLAIDMNENIKNVAKNEEDFDKVKEYKEFKELIEK